MMQKIRVVFSLIVDVDFQRKALKDVVSQTDMKIQLKWIVARDVHSIDRNGKSKPIKVAWIKEIEMEK